MLNGCEYIFEQQTGHPSVEGPIKLVSAPNEENIGLICGSFVFNEHEIECVKRDVNNETKVNIPISSCNSDNAISNHSSVNLSARGTSEVISPANSARIVLPKTDKGNAQ
jgi:hypothetical protein